MIFFKEKFKAIRESLDLTQEDIARYLGIKRQSIQRWEDGVCNPRKPKIYKIAELFHCSPGEFADYEPGEFIEQRISKKEFAQRIESCAYKNLIEKSKIEDAAVKRFRDNLVLHFFRMKSIPDEIKFLVMREIEQFTSPPEVKNKLNLQEEKK